jgi:hypothetical protein
LPSAAGAGAGLAYPADAHQACGVCVAADGVLSGDVFGGSGCGVRGLGGGAGAQGTGGAAGEAWRSLERTGAA